jgi:hypothetical protein
MRLDEGFGLINWKQESEMRLEKARWYNDAECVAVLTIDDLSYGYLDPTGRGVQPLTDWGYACRRENSIFHYFETRFLQRFPEVRYTVFVPYGARSALLAEGGAESCAPRVRQLIQDRALRECMADAGAAPVADRGSEETSRRNAFDLVERCWHEW